MDIYKDFCMAPTGNLCDSNGNYGVMDPAIKPLDRRMSVCGRAYTVACAAGDNLTIHKAIALCEPGDVLVINCGGYVRAGVFGEMLAISCRAKGVAGVVIDGGIRDRNDLIDMNFPTFAAGNCPAGTTKDTCGAVGGTVMCGGVAVATGDVIVGDCDGVVVVKKEDAPGALKRALAKKDKEDAMRPLLERGELTADLMDLRKRF